MGLPICMPSRQTDGPCCPMYSLLSSLGGAGSVSAPASVMETSASREIGTKPYEVGIIAFGVSSPAYPARSVDEPMSKTRADTSSGRVSCQGHKGKKLHLKTYHRRIVPFCARGVCPRSNLYNWCCVRAVRIFLIFLACLVFRSRMKWHLWLPTENANKM